MGCTFAGCRRGIILLQPKNTKTHDKKANPRNQGQVQYLSKKWDQRGVHIDLLTPSQNDDFTRGWTSNIIHWGMLRK